MRIRKVLTEALLTVCCFSADAFCIEPVNSNLSPTAREVLNYLASTYQTKMLCGYNVYVHTPDDYEQTAKQGAIWGRDIRWLGEPSAIANHAKKYGYILTLHWHWFYNDDSAWTSERKNPVDVAKIVTPGTNEHRQAITEMAAAADALQILEDADVPVLWRPLHEIDGGWFWWTDKDTPENTAKLWRMMYDYLTCTRKLDNLIWVYSAGVGMVDLALGKEVVASSGESPQKAVDGDYHSTWLSGKNEDEWIYVDLGQVCKLSHVNLLWGWKIHAEDYSIDVALKDPNVPASWTTVYSETGRPYITWEATYRIGFATTPARYVRMHATKRAGRQTWGGYQLAAFEVPVHSKSVQNGVSSHSTN
jgi:hypothetical protein